MPDEALQVASDAVAKAAKAMAYRREASEAVLIADLQQLEVYDASIEQLRAKWGWGTLCAWLAGAGVGYGGISAEHDGVTAIAIGLLVAAVAVTAKWRSYVSKDMPNERYRIAERVVAMVGRDCGGEDLSLDIDLSDTAVARFETESYKRDPWTFTIYENPWMQVTGSLLDGTRFSLTVTERVKKRSGWTRGRSGKMKHKTKLKNKHLAELRVTPRNKKHPHLARAAKHARGAVQLERSEAASRGVRLDKGTLRLKVQLHCIDSSSTSTRSPLDAEETGNVIAGMFLSLYQVVQLSSELRKSA